MADKHNIEDDFEDLNTFTNEEAALKIAEIIKHEGEFDRLRQSAIDKISSSHTFMALKKIIDQKILSYLESLSWEPDMDRRKVRDKLIEYLKNLTVLSASMDTLIAEGYMYIKEDITVTCANCTSSLFKSHSQGIQHKF